MPVIKRRIEGEMGIKVILWEHFHTAVALGAASHAARIRSNSQTNDSDKRSLPPEVSEDFSQEVFSENRYEDVPSCGAGLSRPVAITSLNSHEESRSNLVTYKTKDLSAWEWFLKTSRFPPFKHWQLEQIVFDGDNVRIAMRNGANFHLKVGEFEITKSYICDFLWFDFGLYHKIRIKTYRQGVTIFITGCDEQFAYSEWEDIKRRFCITTHVPPRPVQGFTPLTRDHSNRNDKSSHQKKSPPELHKRLPKSQGSTTKPRSSTLENEGDYEQQALIATRLEYKWREWWMLIFAKYLRVVCYVAILFSVIPFFLLLAGKNAPDNVASLSLFGTISLITFVWSKTLFKLWKHCKVLTLVLLIPSSVMIFGIIGWLPFLFMFGKKGKYLFSDEYKKIISATPMVRIKVFRGPVIEQ
jgi:hypothetical protein